jgi:DNA-binding response OmpR family regulator
MAEIRNISYDVNIPPGSFEASFDHEKLETVLYNLLSNAFKFTPDGGRISFEANLSVNDEGVSIQIADTGPGIPHSEVDKIFDRFYQVDSSSSRDYEGSGIGLSLVKELVQLMEGRVQVESTVGSGTTFKVILPLKGSYEEAPESVVQDATVLQASNGSTETKEMAELLVDERTPPEALVLLIEDNEDLRIYLKENLEAEYQVVVAENGKVGLEKALELIPDLILSDMMMPQMDGFTLCTKIREDQRTSHIPFILLTARTTIESKLEGLELGADEYMTKPFNIKEIKVRMKNLLEQRKNLRKSFSREVTIQPKNISVTSVDERFLNQALQIVEDHLSDEQFSVERFAEEIGMSRKNLLRKIKAMTDQSVNEFIRNFRLNRAAQLLEAKAGSVSEVAYKVGFNNLSYFSKCFKEVFGQLPNEYSGRKAMIDEE